VDHQSLRLSAEAAPHAGSWRLQSLAAEFRDGGVEQQYRVADEPHQRHLVVIMCLIALALAALADLDLSFQNTTVTPWVTASRMANIALAAFMLIAVWRRAGYRAMDHGMLLLGLLIVIQTLFFQAMADPDKLAPLARDLGVIALGHILLPTRFVNAMLVMNTLMIVALIRVLGFFNLDPDERVALAAMFIAVSFAGMAMRWRRERGRRQNFALAAELADARQVVAAAKRAKSSLLAAMSDEMRRPMNGVISTTELLDQTRLDNEQRSLTRIVRQNASAVLGIIDDILDFSKIEAGRMELERLEFSLPELVEEVAGLLAPQAAEKGLELTTFIDPALPDRVLGDAARLHRIVLNLTGNAIKFTDHGAVGIGVSGRFTEAEARFEFRVADTGIGLTAAERERLFQPLRRADGGPARRYGGSGLRFGICRHLVEMMGGRIDVESRSGQGATFFFGLVLETAAQQRRAAPDLAPACVLLAARATPTSEGAALYLAHAGVRVTTAASGSQALALLQGAAEGHFAAALIDHQLPGMDGLALGRKLLADTRLEGCKTIFMAPHEQPALRAAAEETGFFASLTTPLRRDLLWQTVAAALKD
jgi:signal transduction histidine kinase/CheY-like chemotaxis protein